MQRFAAQTFTFISIIGLREFYKWLKQLISAHILQILQTAKQAVLNLPPLPSNKDETTLEVSGSGAQNSHSQYS